MKTYEISVRSLVEFILRSGDIESGMASQTVSLERALLGTRLHQKLQRKEKGDYRKEVVFEWRLPLLEDELLISGRADGVFTFTMEKAMEEEWQRLLGKEEKDDYLLADELLRQKEAEALFPGIPAIDEIKSTAVELNKIHQDTFPLHFAQAAFYGYMLAQDTGADHVLLRVTYIHVDTEEVKHLYKLYTKEELAAFFEKVTAAYKEWLIFKIRWDEIRNQSLQTMTFPFDTYRQGQKEMMEEITHAIKKGENLFLQAPTGIGKTISALYPALGSMAEGKTEKVFYLTAKNVTGSVALDALAMVREKSGAELKVLSMTAKDTICPLEKRSCNAVDCPYARGHFDRVNEAVLTSLKTYDIFDKETILAISQKYQTCPHETALDIASWCDVIVADMNYAFDPSARLKRFFQADKQPFVLLVDEAHNLVDRARDMFSAALSEKDLAVLKRSLPMTPGLKRSLDALGKFFRENGFLMGERKVIRGVESTEDPLLTDEFETIERIPEWDQYGQTSPVFTLDLRWKDAIFRLTENARDAMERLEQESHRIDDTVFESYFNILFFTRILEDHGTGYELLLEKAGRSLILKLFCVDPSKPISAVSKGVLSTIFFSGTLQPLPYFLQLLSDNKKDRSVEYASPFRKERRLVMTAPVSETFRNRDRNLGLTAQLIAQAVEGKMGHYMAFMPSFAYLMQMQKELSTHYPHIPLMIQESGMGQEERLTFLKDLRSAKGTVLGLCVLGGVFSEGIDLREEELIGAIIVSAGLPQVGTERDIIKEHFEDDGFLMAYTYPGMNRVLQAAGRVIRTEKDKGIVLLIDERFEAEPTSRLFPEDYGDRVSVNPRTLPGILQDFWNRMDEMP